MDERFDEQAPAALLDEGLSEVEVRALLERLTHAEYEGGEYPKVRDVIEATGADPRTIAEMLVEIRKEEFEKRFGLRQDALEERVEEHEERIEDLEAGSSTRNMDWRDPRVRSQVYDAMQAERANRNAIAIPFAIVLAMLMVMGVLVLASNRLPTLRAHQPSSVWSGPLPGPSQVSTPQAVDSKRFVEGANAFAFSLAKAMRLGAGHDNGLVCTYGAYKGVCLLRSGVIGDPAQELAGVLGMDGVAPKAISGFYRSNELQRRNEALSMGNALFCRALRTSPSADFNDALKYGSGGKAERLPLDGNAAVRMINGWSASQTGYRIERLVNRVEPGDAIILASVADYNDWYEVPFDKVGTHTAVFSGAGGKKRVHMMSLRLAALPYAEVDGAKCVRLDVAHGRWNLTLLLPKPGTSPSSLLTPAVYDGLTKALAPGRCDLSLPTVALDATNDLVPALQRMGVKGVFEPSYAMGGIVGDEKPSYVGQVVQRVQAGLGQGMFHRRLAPADGTAPAGNRFKADRPFAFVMQDKHDGLIVMMGVVNRP